MSVPTTPGAGRLPLRRPPDGRMAAGVAAGLGAHLAVPVGVVRWVFVLGTAVLGAGAVLYLWLWLTVPPGDPRAAAPVQQARLAPRLRTVSLSTGARDVAVAVILLLTAALLLLWRADVVLPASWLVPGLIVAAGAALAWGQLAQVQRAGDARRGTVVLRVGGGVALAVIGSLLLVGPGNDLGDLVRGAAAGLAILAGVAIVLAPVLLRLVRELSTEREARARESERADIAAHLHDSVLQTLSMIRSRAGDDQEVARLARAQERELRDWLYTDRPAPGTSTAEEVRRVAAEVEDRFGTAVEVVTAGDAEPDERTAALAAAAREALTNAVTHGRPPVSLYVEIGAEEAEVFVRDRGDGFDLEAVPPDRHGVRESIMGRMRRHGGTATVRSRASGTEVHLRMPRKGQQ